MKSILKKKLQDKKPSDTDTKTKGDMGMQTDPIRTEHQQEMDGNKRHRRAQSTDQSTQTDPCINRKHNKSVGVSFSHSILIDTEQSSESHTEMVFRKEKSMPQLKNNPMGVSAHKGQPTQGQIDQS